MPNSKPVLEQCEHRSHEFAALWMNACEQRPLFVAQCLLSSCHRRDVAASTAFAKTFPAGITRDSVKCQFILTQWGKDPARTPHEKRSPYATQCSLFAAVLWKQTYAVCAFVAAISAEHFSMVGMPEISKTLPQYLPRTTKPYISLQPFTSCGLLSMHSQWAWLEQGSRFPVPASYPVSCLTAQHAIRSTSHLLQSSLNAYSKSVSYSTGLELCHNYFYDISSTRGIVAEWNFHFIWFLSLPLE